MGKPLVEAPTLDPLLGTPNDLCRTETEGLRRGSHFKNATRGSLRTCGVSIRTARRVGGAAS